MFSYIEEQKVYLLLCSSVALYFDVNCDGLLLFMTEKVATNEGEQEEKRSANTTLKVEEKTPAKSDYEALRDARLLENKVTQPNILHFESNFCILFFVNELLNVVIIYEIITIMLM